MTKEHWFLQLVIFVLVKSTVSH
ncbi:hypothetical protein VCHENC02_3472A, partial [Vibrio harveyi]